MTKIESIKEELSRKSVLVASGGGVDSTVLASIVKESAARTLLLLVASPTVSKKEIESARLIAEEPKADLLVKEFDWLSQDLIPLMTLPFTSHLVVSQPSETHDSPEPPELSEHHLD